jgi:hypothetical protein
VETRHQIGATMLCLASLAVAGCGGNGATSAPAVGSEFAAKATAICDEAHRQKQAQGSFSDPGFNPTNPDPAKLSAVAAFIDEGTAIYTAWLQEMRALGSPPSGQGAWADVLAAIDAQLQQHVRQHAAAVAGDTTAFANEFVRGARARDDMERAAKAAGLPACATVEG